MDCATESDTGTGAEMLAASGCTAGRGRFLGRGFLSVGTATTAGSSAGGACSVVGRRFLTWWHRGSAPIGLGLFLFRGAICAGASSEAGGCSVQVQCLASGPLRQFSRLIRPSSFSACEFESSRRSEIDPEDSPKSPPVLASGAHRRSKYQCTQRRRSRCGQTWRKCPPHVSNVNSPRFVTQPSWVSRRRAPCPHGQARGSLSTSSGKMPALRWLA